MRTTVSTSFRHLGSRFFRGCVATLVVMTWGLPSPAAGDDAQPVFFQPSLEAGQVAQLTGAASYSVPLEVPVGAGGLHIPLTLTYSSANAAARHGDDHSDGGWLGIGWDLDVGRIELTGGTEGDHRLLLDGESTNLAYVDSINQSQECEDADGWSCTGQSLVRLNAEEARYWRIEKTERSWQSNVCTCSSGACGPPPYPSVEGFVRDDSKFQVWDKSGVRYDFGVDAWDAKPWFGWSGSEEELASRTYHLRYRDGDGPDKKEAWFRGWGLERIVDPSGNTLEVEWRKFKSDSWNHNCGEGLPHEGYKEIYPRRILYTTNVDAGDAHAEWEVEFVTERKDVDTLADHAIAQSGVKLDAVRVWFHPVAGSSVLVREVTFDYLVDENEGRRSYRLQSIQRYGKGGADGSAALPPIVFDYELKTIVWNEKAYDRYFLGHVENGYGGSVDLTYRPFEAQEFQTQVVEQRDVDPGLGPIRTTRFTYLDPVVEVLGNGTHPLIGFREVWEESADRRVKTGFHATHDDPDHPLHGKKTWRLTEELDGTNYDYSEWEWATTERFRPGSSVNAGWFVRVQETRDFLYNGTASPFTRKTRFLYDVDLDPAPHYGNLRLRRFYDDNEAVEPYRDEWTSYATDDDSWIVDRRASHQVFEGGTSGLPLERTDYVWQAGEVPVLGTVDDRGLLRAERRYKWVSGEARVRDVRYGYDAFGNRTHQTRHATYGSEAAYSSSPLAPTVFEYDPDYPQFQVAVVNPLGHRRESYYFYVNGAAAATEGLPGQLGVVRDANGVWRQVTHYDAFGRKTAIWDSDADAGDLAKANRLFAYDEEQRMLKTSVRDDDGSGSHFLHSWTFFDGLGRIVQTQKAWNATDKQLVHTRYDDLGRVASVTTPYAVAWGDDQLASEEWARTDLSQTSYTYDVLDRPLSVVQPNGLATVSSYDGPWGQVSTENASRSRRTTQVYDTRGNAVATRELDLDGGAEIVTTRQYDALGRLLRITDAQGHEVQIHYNAFGEKTTEIDPDRGTTSWEYDALGRLKETQNAAGQRSCAWYDVLDRPVAREHRTSECPSSAPADSPTVYAYDQGAFGIGRLRTAENEHGSRTFVYDRLGRKTRENILLSVPPGPQEFNSFAWTYDEMGRVKTLRYPDYQVATYGYDPHHGRPVSLEAGGVTYVIDAAYRDHSALTRLDFGNGTSTYFTHHNENQNHRLAKIHTVLGGSLLQDVRFAYDDDGNVERVVDYQGANTGWRERQLFEYDFLDRLTRAHTADPSAGSYDLAFRYDDLGNLTGYDDETGTHQWTYRGAHGKDALDGQQRFGYDAAGRVVDRLTAGGSSYRYHWDADDRLTRVEDPVTDVNLAYDADGSLVAEQRANVTTFFLNGLAETQVTLLPSTGGGACGGGSCGDEKTDEPMEIDRRYYYLFDGRRVALRRVKPTGNLQTRYFHGDHLGTVGLQTNASGVVKSELRTLPFGADRWSTGTSQTEYAFTGERRHDLLGGVYKMGARYYDPEYRTWLTPDTIIPDPRRPQSLNRYAYVENNPLRFVDPTGHDPEPPPDGGGVTWLKITLLGEQRAFQWVPAADRESGGAWHRQSYHVSGGQAPCLFACFPRSSAELEINTETGVIKTKEPGLFVGAGFDIPVAEDLSAGLKAGYLAQQVTTIDPAANTIEMGTEMEYSIEAELPGVSVELEAPYPEQQVRGFLGALESGGALLQTMGNNMAQPFESGAALAETAWNRIFGDD